MTRRQALLLSLGAPWLARTAPAEVASAVQWSPRRVFNGSPVLFTSKTVSGEASWLGKKIEFRLDPETNLFTALAGVNLDRPRGRYALELGGEAWQVGVARQEYPVSRVRVPRRFVQPPKSERPRIAEENAFKKEVFDTSVTERLWRGAFRAPLETRRTSVFGARRVYNGKTRGIHQGLDFDANLGSLVSAANAGRVVIARPMYFEGGLVVIDHGESIFTMYFHLSEFLVQEGTRVAKGQSIAKTGATGRVTGPHLHFALRWQGHYLDPSTLLTL